MAFNPVVKADKIGGVKDTAIFLAVSFFIFYIIDQFIKYLFRPLYESGEEVSERIKERIETKQSDREAYLKEIEEDENDPMHQFQLRHIIQPKEYKGDSDNDMYKTWYGNWKQGLVLDSGLRWVPTMWKDSKFTPSFLSYITLQHSLHKKAPFSKRMMFLNTVRKYYPEFAANMSDMEEDLIRYNTMDRNVALSKDLNEEIQKFGLSEELADYLSEQKVTARTLKKRALFLKEFTEKGCSDGVAVMALENRLSIDEALDVESLADNKSYPIDVGLALVKKEITEEDAQEFLKNMDSMQELFGDEIDDVHAIGGKTTTPYLKASIEILESLKNKRRATKFN